MAFSKIFYCFVIISTPGVRSVCEDTSGGGEEGEEEQADAGQRRVQEDDGGGEAYAQVKAPATLSVTCILTTGPVV